MVALFPLIRSRYGHKLLIFGVRPADKRTK
jgi:hypothetical protein